MYDSQILNVLIDEFGTYDTMVFCHLYTRYLELSEHNSLDSKLDRDFEHYFFEQSVDKLRDKIIEEWKQAKNHLQEEIIKEN